MVARITVRRDRVASVQVDALGPALSQLDWADAERLPRLSPDQSAPLAATALSDRHRLRMVREDPVKDLSLAGTDRAHEVGRASHVVKRREASLQKVLQGP